ncbi:hypothetical protein ACA910_009458 [Epithemia clementina (nom. ined.)]
MMGLTLLLAVLFQCAPLVQASSSKLDDPAFLGVVVATGVCGLIGLLYLFKLFMGQASGPPKVLPLADFTPFPLIQKEVLSHDTCRFTLGFPSSSSTGPHVLGLPIGQHLSLKFTDPATGKAVQRSYTPVTNDTTVDQVQLVIKVYRPLPPKFPQGGLMSQHLDSLKIGDTILVKGPKGHLQYHGKGKFSTKPLGQPLEQRSCRCMGLLAGGTGITPMLQLLQAVLVHPDYRDQQTQIKLIYANQTPADILVRAELEALANQFPQRFQLWYTVDRLSSSSSSTNTNGDNDVAASSPPSEWNYDVGFIDKKMIQNHLVFPNAPKGQTQVFMCGPPPMIKFACIPALQELGFTEKDWSVF